MAEQTIEQDSVALYDAISSHTSAEGIHAELFPTGVALCSIAISLKRIADEVCGVAYDYAPSADNAKHKAGLIDGVMTAIEQGIINAARMRG